MKALERIPAWRLGLLLVVLSVGVFANSIPNGFAYDDPSIVSNNPTVTDGDVLGAFVRPYWPAALAGAGLYRPVTVASFAAEWSIWGDSPAWFHLVNVLLHALVVVLLFLLLKGFVDRGAAFLGAALFAVHPVHTEAVANVVGRSELLALAFVLVALLLAIREPGGDRARAWRWSGIAALYALGLGSKEIAVTLPGLVVLLSMTRRGWADGLRHEWGRWPLYLLCSGVLATYLIVRGWVLGSVTGELPAPYLDGLTDGQRVLTAISVWVQYARLLLLPLDLASDYGPAVLLPARSFDIDVLMGLGVGAVALGVAIRSRRAAPVLALGVAWTALALLPISNLLFPIGVLLAERTLYLPSVGLSFAVAGAVAWVFANRASYQRLLIAGCALVLVAFGVRTVERNPSWMSTFAMLDTLSRDHPESFLAVRARASGLAGVGEYAEAARLYEITLEMTPTAYAVLIEVGRFYEDRGNLTRAAELFERGTSLLPVHPAAWQERSELLLVQGQGRAAHRMALDGLRHTAADRELWMLVSESYVAKGDFAAAARARIAALGAEPETIENWARLAEIYRMDGDESAALGAEARARALSDLGSEPVPETHPLGVGGA